MSKTWSSPCWQTTTAYALTAPYLKRYGAKNNMPTAYDFTGETVAGQNETLHNWECCTGSRDWVLGPTDF